MSRRSHHPARRHVRAHPEARPPRPAPASEAPTAIGPDHTGAPLETSRTRPFAAAPPPTAAVEPPPLASRPPAAAPEPPPAGVPTQPGPAWTPPFRGQGGPPDGERNGCTAPQLRRFIKSRAYVPMHELRRRFAIEGSDDDVTAVDMDPRTRVFVGLPNREGRLLGELLRSGDIGYELSFDPIAPIVVGVFPMRPVPRA